MFITEKQLETLKTAPLTVETDTGVYGGWSIDQDDCDEERLQLSFNRFQISRHYDRYITRDGDVERWDEDADVFVAATFEPLVGEYSYRSQGKTTTRQYLY